MKLFHLPALCLFLFFLMMSGCATVEPLPSGTIVQVTSPIVSRVQLTVPPPAPEEISGDLEYRIGLGDVLSVSSVQINQVAKIAEDGTIQQPGYRVYSSGKVFLPLVGGDSGRRHDDR